MTIGLILVWIASGTVIAPTPPRFATMDLCENAKSLAIEDITNRGGTVSTAWCAVQSLQQVK